MVEQIDYSNLAYDGLDMTKNPSLVLRRTDEEVVFNRDRTRVQIPITDFYGQLINLYEKLSKTQGSWKYELAEFLGFDGPLVTEADKIRTNILSMENIRNDLENHLRSGIN